MFTGITVFRYKIPLPTLKYAILKKLCDRFSYLLKSGTTWNDLQQARDDLKRPTTSKKRPETTWSNLKWARNDMKRPTMSKKRTETTCKEQFLQYLQYFVSFVHLRNDDRQKNQSKCLNQTKQSKKILNNHLISYLTGLAE